MWEKTKKKEIGVARGVKEVKKKYNLGNKSCWEFRELKSDEIFVDTVGEVDLAAFFSSVKRRQHDLIKIHVTHVREKKAKKKKKKKT